MSDLTEQFYFADAQEHVVAARIASRLNNLSDCSDFGCLGAGQEKTSWAAYQRKDTGEYVVGAYVMEPKTIANAASWLEENEIIFGHLPVMFRPPEEEELAGAERRYMIVLRLMDVDEQKLREVNAHFTALSLADLIRNSAARNHRNLN